jgi:hypothetical protein
MRTLRSIAAIGALSVAVFVDPAAAAKAAKPVAPTAAAKAAKPAPPAGVPAGWEVKLVEAPREIGLGTMSVNVWAHVGRPGAEPVPACVLVLKDQAGAATYVDMQPVDGVMDKPAEEVVATIDTYTWVREGAHSWEIRATSATGAPTVLAHGAIRVKPRVSTPDLVLMDEGGLVQPWVGSGAGGFTPGAAQETGAPGGAPMIVDVDGDHLLDLVVPSRDGSIRLLQNAGNGRLEPGREIPLPLDLAASAVGDVDGDGAADLVTASASGTLEIRFSLSDDPGAAVELPLAPDRVQVADLDGNGKGEIYVAMVGISDGEVQVVRPGPGGDWTVMGTLSPPEGGRGRVREMQRIPGLFGRGDGLLVLSTREGEGTLESWGCRADTGTEPGLRTGVRLAGEPIGLTCGRFLGPGALPVRIVLIREGRGAELIAIGKDDVPRRVGSIDKAPEAIVALDLDGDGDDDLATAADDLRLWINVGGTEFREAGESPYLLQSPVIALSSGSLDERIP